MAMRDMNLVMDISTATGTDSATVADALAKAYQGNFKALRSLSPEMATMIKEGASLNEIMDVLGGTFGGATAASAETAAGKMKILSNSIGETKESIGAALLPVVEAVLPILNKFAMWAQDNPQAFLAIAGAIGAVAAAIVVTNIAMALNPFALIAAGIALLVVALVTAYNKFEWFRDGIKAIVNTVIGFFAGMVNAAIGAVNAIVSAYNSIPLLPDLPKVPNLPVPQIGGTPTQVAGRMNLPRLAEGGIVTAPTLALIGEAGPEAVVPLDRMQSGGGITINVTGGLATSAEIGESVVNALRAYSRSAGPLQLQVA
jgi:phage-related protein